ncbi:MAG: hypothetical protein ACLRHS_08995 [Roseburia inulinivorans]|uniref:hypothetical protein n=1 Tax=Roseburia inulinivorans TaxID=360807 RepID=UPI001D221B86|nr:hypothetical protein [Roseburia inulinivorans]MBS5231682.1 hypothetical protein [Roseburia sp.]
MGEILGRIRDGTLFKNADKVSVVARSTDGAGVLAKHADEAAAWQHGGKVFRYSDETAEAVASGEKLLKESGTIYESFADMMSPEDAKRYLDFLERWKQRRIDRCRAGRSGNGRYNMEVLQEDRIMYRAGNVQNPYGRWFTSEDIMLCKLI